MASSIIHDAKYQELNMSFTFDDSVQDKLIVNALADHTPYQLQLTSNPDIDFQDIKNALQTTQFKIIARSPELLKLKIAFASFEFKNVEKITLNTLKQKIAELQQTIAKLSQKLKDQTQKNGGFQDSINQVRKQLDLHTTQFGDLRQASDENKEQSIKIKREFKQLMEKAEDQIRKKFEENHTLLEERVRKLEGDRVEQMQEKASKEEKERISRENQVKMIELTERVERMEEKQKGNEWGELQKLYEKKLKLLQEREKEETGKRESWEMRVLLMMEEKVKQMHKEHLQEWENMKATGREQEKQREEKQRRVKQEFAERHKKMEQEMAKWVKNNELKGQAEEAQRAKERQVYEEKVLKLEEEKKRQQLSRRQEMEKLIKFAVEAELKRREEEQRKLEQPKRIEQQQRLREIERQQKLLQEKIRRQQEEKEERERQYRLKLEQQKQLLQQKISTQNQLYLFSSKHKSHKIQIQNNNTKVSGFGLGLVDGVVFEKGSSIKFRILSINKFGVVGVGLGIRNVIAGNGYQIKNRDQIGHGCFIVSSSFGYPKYSYSYSHSHKEHNGVKIDFHINEQDVIKVQTNGEELCFMNERSKKEFKMKIKLSEDEWKQACFCVYLDRSSSQVEIVK